MTNYQKICKLEYTDSEKAQLLKCRDEISSWIEENVVPFLEKGDYICCRSSERNSNGSHVYKINVFPNPVSTETWAKDYRSRLKSRITIGEMPYKDFHKFAEEKYSYNLHELFLVVSDWKEIKASMLSQLEFYRVIKEEKEDTLKNFEV